MHYHKQQSTRRRHACTYTHIHCTQRKRRIIKTQYYLSQTMHSPIKWTAIAFTQGCEQCLLWDVLQKIIAHTQNYLYRGTGGTGVALQQHIHVPSYITEIQSQIHLVRVYHKSKLLVNIA